MADEEQSEAIKEEESTELKDEESTEPKDEESTEQKEEESPELKNAVTIEEAGPCKKKVIIEIPQAKIKKLTEKQYEDLRKEALVPGFRKGRAPRRLLEKRFGKETKEQINLTLLSLSSFNCAVVECMGLPSAEPARTRTASPVTIPIVASWGSTAT